MPDDLEFEVRFRCEADLARTILRLDDGQLFGFERTDLERRIKHGDFVLTDIDGLLNLADRLGLKLVLRYADEADPDDDAGDPA